MLVPRLVARPSRRTPLVSVIVPARDEERTIEPAVRALIGQDWPALEVIVVDDRSVDATGEILDRLAREHPRLVVVHGEEPPAEWLGKSWALHQGSAVARGELLLFVDADVIYAPSTISATVAHIERSGAGMVSLIPHLVVRGFWEHLAMPYLSLAIFTLVPIWLANRTRLPALGLGGGPGNLVRREAYEATGGHEALKSAVVDDIALGQLVRGAGFRTEVVRAEHFVSVRMYHGLGELVDGFTKNVFAAFRRSYLAAVLLLVVWGALHLVPYALAFTGNPIAIGAVALITLVRLIVFLPRGYRIDNAILGDVPMFLLWAWILIRSMWLTGARRQLRWRGRVYDASRTRFGAE